MNAHRDTGEHRQAYTFTGSYHWRQDTGGATPSPPRSYPYRRIPTQEDRTPTQATGSPLLARSPSRSMMIHRKGNEHSQGHRDTGTPTQGRHPYRLLPLATTDTGDRLALARSYPYRRIPTQEGHRQEDRNTQGRHPRSCCSPLLALALPLGL